MLGEKPLAGNSKVAQMKRWGNYFTYERQGQKFTIKELYETPLPHVDGRKLKAGIYVGCVECLLMNFLLQHNGKLVYLSKLDWLLKLGMVNERFAEYIPLRDRAINEGVLEVTKEDKERFSPLEKAIATRYHLQLGSEDVSVFYDLALEKGYSILNSSIKSMENRKLIKCSKIYIIVYDDGTRRIVDDSKEELAKVVLRLQRQALKTMGFEKINQVYTSHQVHKYYCELKKQIEKHNRSLEEGSPKWSEIRERTKIIYLEDEIQKQLPISAQSLVNMTEKEVIEHRRDLNEKVVNSLNELVYNRKTAFDKQYGDDERFDENPPNKQNYWALKRHNRQFALNVLAKENFQVIQSSLINYLIRLD